MRPRVAHLSKFCVLDEIFARFSQDAQVNETLPRCQNKPVQWGYIHVLNLEKKKCIKSDFKEFSLKLATNG